MLLVSVTRTCEAKNKELGSRVEECEGPARTWTLARPSRRQERLRVKVLLGEIVLEAHDAAEDASRHCAVGRTG